MKIIDLLNKIAKGEEVQDFYIYGEKFYVDEDGYIKNKYGNVEWYINKDWLDVEIEIIEEEKEIEEINPIDWNKCIHEVTHKEKELAIEIHETQKKINELVRELNKIKKEGK